MPRDRLLPRERVLQALSLREPDRVPWVELEVEQVVIDKILNQSHQPSGIPLGLYNRNVEEEKAFSRRIGKDNILYSFRPPVFCEFHEGDGGIIYYGQGHIRCRDDLKKMIFPDLEDKRTFKPVMEFVKNKGEFAAMATTRLGFAATYLSIGMAEFFDLLYEDMDFVLEVMSRYTRWLKRAMELVSDIGFDLVSASDDLAMGSGPLISPKMFKDTFLPPMQEVARSISVPWLAHSDGNMMPLMETWLELGQNGIHPIEPAAMDIRQVKGQYGNRACIIGNVDVDMLSRATPEQIDKMVKELIRDIAPAGGYMLSSGNSLAASVRTENVLAMGQALAKYGRYPIKISGT